MQFIKIKLCWLIHYFGRFLSSVGMTKLLFRGGIKWGGAAAPFYTPIPST